MMSRHAVRRLVVCQRIVCLRMVCRRLVGTCLFAVLCLPCGRADERPGDAGRAAKDPQSATPGEGLRVGSVRVQKILFLGNSITLHAPAPQIGWTGNWGMAASSADKDYVHQLLARVVRQTGGKPQVKVRNIAELERNPTMFPVRERLREELEFQPDLIILAIGENAAAPTTAEARQQLREAWAGLLAEFRRNGKPTVLVRSQFWPDESKDSLLRQVCQDAGGIFVDIGRIGRDPLHSARAERTIEHSGIAAHPGDQGMAAIADTLWNALQTAGGPR